MIHDKLFKRFNISKDEFKKLSSVDQLNFRYRYNDIKETLNFDSISFYFAKAIFLIFILSYIGLFAFYYSEILVTFFSNLIFLAANFFIPICFLFLILDLVLTIKARKLYLEYTRELITDYFDVKPTTAKNKRVTNGKSKSK